MKHCFNYCTYDDSDGGYVGPLSRIPSYRHIYISTLHHYLAHHKMLLNPVCVVTADLLLMPQGTVVAAGTTTALIMLMKKWERHRAKKGNNLGENHFLERWGFFSMSSKFGQLKYPRTRVSNHLDTYPGGHMVGGDGKNGGVDNDRKQKNEIVY